MKREAGHVNAKTPVRRRSLEASVHRAFSERVYFRIHYNSLSEYSWHYLSTSPDWLMALGIQSGGSVLSGIHESDRQRTLRSLHGILSDQTHAARMRVRFRGEDDSYHYLRMNLVQSGENENAIDGYLERDEPDERDESAPLLATDLERRQQELAVAVAQSPISVVITDPEGTITYVNPFFEELSGYSAAEVLGKNPRMLRSDTAQPITNYAAMWKTLAAGKTWTGEFLNRKKNGTIYRERANLVPLINSDQEVTSIVGLKEDITELTTTITKLKEKEEHFRSLFDNAGAAIYIHDTSGIIREANPMASIQTGYAPGELIGMHVGQLDAGTGNEPPEEVMNLLESDPEERAHHVTFGTTERRKDGTTFPAEVTLFLFSSREEQLIAATVVDATERTQHLARIQQSAEENAILLRELHHRVKNNLQSIASLLRLQLGLLRDSQDRTLFEDNINRVLSMAVIHGMLDEATTLKDVDLKGYLKQLRNHLLDWSATRNKRVSITVEGSSVVAGIEQAVPFGIIANELAMDAIQRTTTDDKPREIAISIHGNGNCATFIIRDNGAPEAGEFLRESGNGFATTLIHALTQQIGGTLHNLPGTDRQVELTFPPNGPSIGDAS